MATTTLYPTKDTYLDFPDMYAANGALTYANLHCDSSYNLWQFAVLEFNLSGITGTITSLKLRIYVNSTDVPSTQIQVGKYWNFYWDESTFTYWEFIMGNNSFRQSAYFNGRTLTTGWNEFDISELIGILDSATNVFGINLSGEPGGYTAQFSSKEGSYDPELVVVTSDEYIPQNLTAESSMEVPIVEVNTTTEFTTVPFESGSIYAIEDCYCSQVEPNTPHNTSHIYVRDGPSSWDYTFLKFPIQDVSVPVENCYLVLPIQAQGSQTSPLEIYIIRMNTNAWHEDTVTYNNFNQTFYWGEVEVTVPLGATSIRVDITSLMNIASDSHMSLFIDLSHGQDSNDYFIDFSEHPHIEINSDVGIDYTADALVSIPPIQVSTARYTGTVGGSSRVEAIVDNYYHGDGTDTKMFLPSGVGAAYDQGEYAAACRAIYLAFNTQDIAYINSCRLHLYLQDYLNDFPNNSKVTLRIAEALTSWFTLTDEVYIDDDKSIYEPDCPTWVDLPTTATGDVSVDITSIVRHAVACGRGYYLQLKVSSWQPFPSANTFFEFGTHEGGHPAWLEIDDTPPNYPTVVVYSDKGVELDGYDTDNNHSIRSYFEVQYASEHTLESDPPVHSHNAFVHFKLDDLGYGIKTAALTFYVTDFSDLNGANPYHLYVDGFQGSIDEATTDYDHPPSGSVLGTLDFELFPIGAEPTEYTVDITDWIHATMRYDGLLLRFRGDSAASPNTGQVFIANRLASLDHAPKLTFECYEPFEATPNDSVDEYNQTAVIRANYDAINYTPFAGGNELLTKDLPDNHMYGCFFQFNLNPIERVCYSYLKKAVLHLVRFPTEYVSDQELFMDIYRYAQDTDWSYQDYEYEFTVSPARSVCNYELDITRLLSDSAYDVMQEGHDGNITIRLHNDYNNNHPAPWMIRDDSLPMYIGTAEANMTPYLELEWDFSELGYYVDGRDGDDLNDGLTWQTPWRTLTKAATQALPFSTIYLFSDRLFADEPMGNEIAPVNNGVRWDIYGQLEDYPSYDNINLNESGTVEKLLDSTEYTAGYDGLYDGEFAAEWNPIPAVCCKADGTQHPVRFFFKLREASGAVSHAVLRFYVARVRWAPQYLDTWENIQTEFRLLTTPEGQTIPSVPTDTHMLAKLMVVEQAGRYFHFFYDLDVTYMVNDNTNTEWFGIELKNVPIEGIETRVLIPCALDTDYGDCTETNVRPRLIITR